MINYLTHLVTGTGRCGTKFVSELLSSAGVTCGHELIFSVDTLVKPPDIKAESSWLAAPKIHRIGKQCKIIHLNRDPLKVISSLMKLRYFAAPIEMHRNKRWFEQYKYIKFVYKYLPSVNVYKSEVERCMQMWVGWNNLIEEKSKGRDYIYYRIEDITKQPKKFLLEIGIDPGQSKLFDDPGIDVMRDSIQKFKPSLYPYKDKQFTLAELPKGALKDNLIKEAKRYGYNYG